MTDWKTDTVAAMSGQVRCVKCEQWIRLGDSDRTHNKGFQCTAKGHHVWTLCWERVQERWQHSPKYDGSDFSDTFYGGITNLVSTFDDEYPGADFDFEPRGELVFKSETLGLCGRWYYDDGDDRDEPAKRWCRRPTYWIDLSFQCHVCSPDCQDAMWEDFGYACRPRDPFKQALKEKFDVQEPV